MKKRIGALLIVLALVLACIPTIVFATPPSTSLLMFEEATELEEGGEYLIVAGTNAMTNEEGTLGVQTVEVNDGRIIINEDDAAKSIFSVVDWVYQGVYPHNSGKLVNNDKYLSGDESTKILNLVDGKSNAKIFNTWDGPNRLCGLGYTIKFVDEGSKWQGISGVGTSAVTYKKVDTVTVTFDTAEHGTVDSETELLKVGDKVTEPELIAEPGYHFMGWFKDDTEWDFNTPVNEDITLTAKWDKTVKFELADEIEEDEEYIIVNKHAEADLARVMTVINDTQLNYFDVSVNEFNEVIVGENQIADSVFTAVNYFEEGGLKKANLQMDNQYIGKDAEDRLYLVDSNPGVFNTFDYGAGGNKLCGYGFWIRCTGNNEGKRDGGWWPTDRFGDGYTGAYLYKKVRLEATVTANSYSKLCTEDDPTFEATVTDIEFPYDIEYTIEREAGDTCGEYEIVVTGDAKQGNYNVTYVNGTLTINHVLEKVDGVKPTTKNAGFLDAYRCVGCGTYFADAEGTKLIGDEEAYTKWKSLGGEGYLDKVPDTGDKNNIALWIVLLVMSGMAMAFVGLNYFGFTKRFSFAEISERIKSFDVSKYVDFTEISKRIKSFDISKHVKNIKNLNIFNKKK